MAFSDSTHKGLIIKVQPLVSKVQFTIEIESVQETTERTHTVFGRRITHTPQGRTFHREGRAFFVDAAQLRTAIAEASA